MNEKYHYNGFTLVEFVLIVATLGVLTIGILPNLSHYLAYSTPTQSSQESSLVQFHINRYYAQTVANGLPAWPNALDQAKLGTCNQENPCFASIASPVTNSLWSKVSENTYRLSTNGVTEDWIYEPISGRFRLLESSLSSK